MLNQVVLVGRIADEFELKESENGNKYCSITLAVQRSFKNVDGEYETDFIKGILWGNIAENTTELLKKGDVVGIKGRIQTKEKTNYEGINIGYETQIIAEKVTFLSGKVKDESN